MITIEELQEGDGRFWTGAITSRIIQHEANIREDLSELNLNEPLKPRGFLGIHRLCRMCMVGGEERVGT